MSMLLNELLAVKSAPPRLPNEPSYVLVRGDKYAVIPESWVLPGSTHQEEVKNALRELGFGEDTVSLTHAGTRMYGSDNIMFYVDGNGNNIRFIYPADPDETPFGYNLTLIPNFRKIVSLLGLKLPKEVERYVTDVDDKNLPTTFYHGTTTAHLESIAKFGLMPNADYTNWEDYPHRDLVFVSSIWAGSLFHADNATRVARDRGLRGPYNTCPEPMVIKLSVPDKNILVPDFDVASALKMGLGKPYGSTDEYREGISRGDHVRDKQKRRDWKRYGIYGYLGRIPARYFKAIYMWGDSETLFSSECIIISAESDGIEPMGFHDAENLLEWFKAEAQYLGWIDH
ncbi:MAG: hypothetical protein D6698_06655 [Gammaproteobacteria bacterium]|nr:MAG: hypothetical protein D6698_06655 [Gammaproteobacteria bacterium]